MSSRKSKSKEEAALGRWLGPVLAYCFMLAVSMLFGIISSPFQIRGEVFAVLEMWLMYAAPLFIVYLHVSRFEGRDSFWDSVGVRSGDWKKGVIWAFALFAIFTVIMWIYWSVSISLVGGDPNELMMERLRSFSDWYLGYMVVASFFPVALSEELIFRGFVLDRFLNRGALFAILVSSIMFTSLHLGYVNYGTLGLPMFGGVFLFAISWSIVYWKTKNIIGVVIIHALHNATTYLETLFGSNISSVVTIITFIIGIICLGYLLFGYIRNVFGEIRDLVE